MKETAIDLRDLHRQLESGVILSAPPISHPSRSQRVGTLAGSRRVVIAASAGAWMWMASRVHHRTPRRLESRSNG